MFVNIFIATIYSMIDYDRKPDIRMLTYTSVGRIDGWHFLGNQVQSKHPKFTPTK